MTKEERKIYMQEYRKTKKWKDSKKKSDKKYYNKNKEYIKKLNKEWKLNNLDRFYEINKQWAEQNPEKIKEHQQKYRKNNPHYKIRNLFHNLKKQKYKTLEKTELFYVKKHIESQFSGNMDWNNIEIDHKIPVSWFKKETPIYLINDLENLHPLFIQENRKKSNKHCHPITKKYYLKINKYITEERISQILAVTHP